MKKTLTLGLICGCFAGLTASGQTVIQGFEYANDDALRAEWTAASLPENISLSSYVDPASTGTKSLKLTRNYNGQWAGEELQGPTLASPLVISSNQFVSFRIAGDPAITNGNFRMVYIYGYDGEGRFGRWGSLVPISTNWHTVNINLGGVKLPWDSTVYPDFNNMVKFSIFITGQADPPAMAYDATIYLDDIQIRDTPLAPAPAPGGVTRIDDFEYASDFELPWYSAGGGGGSLTLSDYVAPGQVGTNSIKSTFYYGGIWATEVISGPQLPASLAIRPDQYITFRIAGDPQFVNASYSDIYVYAWDGNGYFGRWRAGVPTGTNWQIVNLRASTLGLTWDATVPPDLNNITELRFYIYGQGDPVGTPFEGTIYLDDLQIRDTALIEFPPASPVRTLIDNFEGYADNTALRAFYSYVNGGAATVTTAALESPAPQGNKALKLTIDFPSIQYPWGSVHSPTLAPFSLPANAVVTMRFKGDPTLLPIADGGTVLYLGFYDQAGTALNFTTTAPVTSSEWTTLRAEAGQFWSEGVVDTGNLVRWRILVEGWQGEPASIPGAMTGNFYVDDIMITVPPVLAVVRQGNALKLQMSSLIPGTTYTLETTENFTFWTSTTIQATSSTATQDIPAGQKGFYRLSYTP